MTHTLHQGDCRAVLATLPECSVDACVTDPPYGLTQARPGGRSAATRGPVMSGFMGLVWDHGVPGVPYWTDVSRVLKPGAHLLAFGGTRTHHRLMCAVEDAGFEIRDCLGWLYGTGFPKSLNLDGDWEGWGTALKPAWEPIILARKPLAGAVAANVVEHGTGALNIDDCRISGADTRRVKAGGANDFPHEDDAWEPRSVVVGSELGRWPANIIHDGGDEVLSVFPESAGQLANASTSSSRKNQNTYGAMARGSGGFEKRGDSGSAARFFYCAKASKSERGEGNTHPTVKPQALMRYLCRLITPPGGTVLDPFNGSGSTGVAALSEGFGYIGIEANPEYIAITERRLSGVQTRLAV